MADTREPPDSPATESLLSEPVGAIINRLDSQVRGGDIAEFVPVPTGFDELDNAIGGGFRQGQLILLGGAAGIGKTSFAMQIARNMAAEQRAVCLFACYEHETDYLVQRLIAMESVAAGGDSLGDGLRLRDISDLVKSQPESHPDSNGFVAAVASDVRGARALERIANYSQDLMFIKGSAFRTTVAALAGEVARVRLSASNKPVVLFVDYLQKIATSTPHTQEEVRNIQALEALKDMALKQGVIIVAIVASQIEGLRARRMTIENMLASSELAYEADIIMVMNEKYNMVDRQHIDYNLYNAQLFHQYVILSIEKNRMGSDLVELQLRKQLQFCRFRGVAERVKESLISGRQRE